jgi:hypothetical protein
VALLDGTSTISFLLSNNQVITVCAESENQPPAFLGLRGGWFARGFLYGLRASTPNRLSAIKARSAHSYRTIVPSGRIADTNDLLLWEQVPTRPVEGKHGKAVSIRSAVVGLIFGMPVNPRRLRQSVNRVASMYFVLRSR